MDLSLEFKVMFINKPAMGQLQRLFQSLKIICGMIQLDCDT